MVMGWAGLLLFIGSWVRALGGGWGWEKKQEGRKQEKIQKSAQKEKEEGRKGKQEEQGHPLYTLTPDRPPRAAAYQ